MLTQLCVWVKKKKISRETLVIVIENTQVNFNKVSLQVYNVEITMVQLQRGEDI